MTSTFVHAGHLPFPSTKASFNPDLHNLVQVLHPLYTEVCQCHMSEHCILNSRCSLHTLLEGKILLAKFFLNCPAVQFTSED